MKKLLLLSYSLFLISYLSFSQNVGIGTTTPAASAALDITSSNKGMLIPRMNATQRNAIVSPAKGLMVFDNKYNSCWYYTGADWKQVGGNFFNSDSSMIIGQQTGIVNSYNL